MRIDYTDEHGAVIPSAPILPQNKGVQELEDNSTWGILSSGWGVFLVVAGIISVALDISSPSVKTNTGAAPVFGAGSLSLGWLFIAGAFVLPPVIFRHFCKKSCHPVFAIAWCVFLVLAWGVVHSASDPGHPARPNLAMFGGIVLCWRLLTKERHASNK